MGVSGRDPFPFPFFRTNDNTGVCLCEDYGYRGRTVFLFVNLSSSFSEGSGVRGGICAISSRKESKDDEEESVPMYV